MLKLTVIHGQNHKGSTYNITKQVIDKILGENKQVDEYFMPIDTPNYCVGCYRCFNEGEQFCPQVWDIGSAVNILIFFKKSYKVRRLIVFGNV